MFTHSGCEAGVEDEKMLVFYSTSPQCFFCSARSEHHLSTKSEHFLDFWGISEHLNLSTFLNFWRSEHHELSTFFDFGKIWAVRSEHFWGASTRCLHQNPLFGLVIQLCWITASLAEHFFARFAKLSTRNWALLRNSWHLSTAIWALFQILSHLST